VTYHRTQSYDNRPEHRSKDSRDITNVITHFFDLKADFIYNEHSDLFTEIDSEPTLEEISAIVIGREIKKISAANESLLKRLKQILRSHIGENEESLFTRNMVVETGRTVEKSIQLLQNILSAPG
jgi:predicted nucleotidyltransferase